MIDKENVNNSTSTNLYNYKLASWVNVNTHSTNKFIIFTAWCQANCYSSPSFEYTKKHNVNLITFNLIQRQWSAQNGTAARLMITSVTCLLASSVCYWLSESSSGFKTYRAKF